MRKEPWLQGLSRYATLPYRLITWLAGFSPKYRSRSMPRPNFPLKDVNSSREKHPHSSFQSPNMDTYPKKIRSLGSYSVAYQVPAPVGLKNLAITIGSWLFSCLPTWANRFKSAFVSNFILFTPFLVRFMKLACFTNRITRTPNAGVKEEHTADMAIP